MRTLVSDTFSDWSNAVEVTQALIDQFAQASAQQALRQRRTNQAQSDQTDIPFFTHGNTRFRLSMAECGL